MGTTRLGASVAEVLAGSWRAEPPPPTFGATRLSSVAPALLGSGGGALAWWRIRHRPDLAESPAGQAVRNAFRIHAAQAAFHKQQVALVVGNLRREGIEPLLVKGWDMARRYPHQGLRPYGDIDLLVPPSARRATETLLDAMPDRLDSVDLVHAFARLDPFGLAALQERAEVVDVAGTPVRVPSAEDGLRLVCLHFLRSGGWRPLCLCDVAVAVEHRPAGFDWRRCLTADPRVAGWVLAVIGLAHRLLGAQVDGTPADGAVGPADRVVRRVQRAWDDPVAAHHVPTEPMPALVHVRGVVAGLRARSWPDPLSATVVCGGRLGAWPVPYQLAAAARRTLDWLAPRVQAERWA